MFIIFIFSIYQGDTMSKVILSEFREKNIFIKDVYDTEVFEADSEVVDTNVRKVVTHFLNKPRMSEKNNALVIKQTVGAGKTTKSIEVVCEHIKKGHFNQPVFFFTTDNTTGQEAYDCFKGHGVNVVHFKGRNSSVCKRAHLLEQAYSQNVKVGNICGIANLDNPAQQGNCEFFDDCSYIETRTKIKQGEIADVYIFPIEYIRVGGIPAELKPSLVIYDEGFFFKVVTTGHLKPDEIAVPWVHSAAHEEQYRILHTLKLQMFEALLNNQDIVPALLERNDTETLYEMLSDVIDLRERENSIDIFELNRNAGETQISEEKTSKQSTEIELFKALKDLVGQKLGKWGNVANCHVLMSSTKSARRIDISIRRKLQFTAPTLCLDASADPDIYEFILNDTHETQFVEIQGITSNLQRIAIVGNGCSKSSLIQSSHQTYESQGKTRDPIAEMMKRRAAVEEVLNKIGEHEKGRKVIICAVKAIADLMRNGEFAVDFCETIKPTIVHYGALKGLNNLKEHETVIQLGKLEIEATEMLRLSRCFENFANARKTNLEAKPKTQIKKYLRTKDNRVAEIATNTYKSTTARALHMYSREEEHIQVEGRLRAIHRLDEDLRSYMISDAIPEALDFSDIYHFDDLSNTKAMRPLLDLEANFNCISMLAYTDEHNCSRQAANIAFKNRGFAKDKCPSGWSAYVCQASGKGGAGSIVYAKINNDMRVERSNVAHHFAKYKNISVSDVIIK